MRLRPLFLLATFGVLATPAAWAQEPSIPASPPADTSFLADPDGDLQPDSLGEVRPGLSFSPKIYAPILYLPSSGFGIGLGVEVKNLGFAGSSLLIQAIPTQRTGQYGAWFQTRSPYTPGPSLLVGGYYETTSRLLYYGVGPSTSYDNEVGIEKELLEGEVRASYGIFPSARLRVQAHARYQDHDLHDARDLKGGSLGRLDARSAARLDGTFAQDARAVAFGADVIYDSRTNLFNPQRGVTLQLGLAQTEPADGDWGGFRRLYASANVFHPILFGDARLAGRALFIDTNAGEDVPYVLLPVLDSRLVPGSSRYRFAANDLLLLTGEVAYPLLDLLGAVAVDGVVSAVLYNAYDDVFKQFTPSVSFAKTLDGARDNTPLRPAAGLGFRFYSYALETLFLDVTLGLSPERLDVGSITLVTDLRLPRALMRGR